jgi:hypothetical protein
MMVLKWVCSCPDAAGVSDTTRYWATVQFILAVTIPLPVVAKSVVLPDAKVK